VRSLLLIYTVPAAPTRKRAFIWRLLKKLGVVYLRDGVCVLPDQAATRAALRAAADKVREFGGQASVAEGAQLDAATEELVRRQACEARRLEYAAVVEAGTALAAHIQRETRHRDLQSAELRLLAGDVLKLRRWRDQIRTRDYFSADGAATAEDVLLSCETALKSISATSAGVPELVP
jgi:hypothetical protein